ncbi:hypothetical protein [Piscinibacter gummiphilus]|uniref:Uncharacterized protein n=1 Tax=Piscinibacter gummiphilus TaxID=946333 RepID=A0ABZ0CS41_9BURK|nr:hypothetical protein [Piscinibacter gummiphilus]WOB05891.1 hypothetical protein RXV79_13260 [Piscinibacter gummiphilus]
MLATSSSHYYAELSDEALRVVAVALLDMRYATLSEMHSPYDDNYTRESTVFGRSRNMLIELATSRKYSWMTLAHAGLDVTFNIGRVPCRFFRDDPEDPEKAGFFRRNLSDSLFAEDEAAPVMWRFVVEKAMTADDEDRVHFVGYNVFQEKVAQWMYRPSTPTLHSVDREVPPAVILQPALVKLRDESVEEEDQQQVGNER